MKISVQFMTEDHTSDITYSSERLLNDISHLDVSKLLNTTILNQIKIYLRDKGINYKNLTPSEAIFFIKNNLQFKPLCKCGQPLVYLWNGKYRKHCSSKCSANDKDTQNLRINTTLEKYGVENIFQDEQVKKQIKQSNVEQYGVDHYCKTSEYKERLKNGSIITNRNSDGIRKGIMKNMYNKLISLRDTLQIEPLFKEEDYIGHGYDKLYDWKCLKCNKEFKRWYYEVNKLYCPYCRTSSNIEKPIIDILTANNIQFIVNSRKLIPPYEIDLYVPSKNIGIEVHGLYWHSQKNKSDNNYHLMKTLEAEKKGIRLIQLFADEVYNKLPIIRNRLLYMIKGNSSSIYARNCTVKSLTLADKRKFINKYHIQGDAHSAINLGLFYKNRLIAVMTFSKLRKVLGETHKDGHWELTRYCTLAHFSIVGGASKLLSYFERLYKPIIVKTYADKRWSQGDMYYKLGFTLDHVSRPNYHYTRNYTERIHRFNFRKGVLKNKLENFDPNLSEWENMKNNGWDRIFDCGNMVFTKTYN